MCYFKVFTESDSKQPEKMCSCSDKIEAICFKIIFK